MVNKNRLFLIIFGGVALVTVAALLYFTLSPKRIQIYQTELTVQGIDEVDYLSPDLGQGSYFLTGKAGSIGRLENGGISIIQRDVIPGDYLTDVVWYENNNMLALSMFNNSEGLADYSGYKDSGEESVFATFDVKKKKLDFLPTKSGLEKLFVVENKLFGESNGKILSLTDGAWKTTNLDVYDQSIYGPNNKYFALRRGQDISVYDNSLVLQNKYRIKTTDYDNIYLFSNGYVGELIEKQTVVIHKPGLSKTLAVGKDEQLLAGNDFLMYSSGSKLMYYLASQNTVYITSVPYPDLSYLYIRFMADDKYFYTDIVGYKSYLWQLKGIR